MSLACLLDDDFSVALEDPRLNFSDVVIDQRFDRPIDQCARLVMSSFPRTLLRLPHTAMRNVDAPWNDSSIAPRAQQRSVVQPVAARPVDAR